MEQKVEKYMVIVYDKGLPPEKVFEHEEWGQAKQFFDDMSKIINKTFSIIEVRTIYREVVSHFKK